MKKYASVFEDRQSRRDHIVDLMKGRTLAFAADEKGESGKGSPENPKSTIRKGSKQKK